MYRRRQWSVRNARWLAGLYAGIEWLLCKADPLFSRIGYERIDGALLRFEKITKGFLLDSQNCGQCIVGSTGLSCPMNCPKSMRNGPCGGVRPDGKCEVEPDMPCVWVLAWQGNKQMRRDTPPIQVVQPPVDHRLLGHSAWLREVRLKRDSNNTAGNHAV